MVWESGHPASAPAAGGRRLSAAGAPFGLAARAQLRERLGIDESLVALDDESSFVPVDGLAVVLAHPGVGHRTGHFDVEVRVLDDGGVGVRDLAILMHVDAARGADADGELGAHRVEDRAEAVEEQIGGNAARVVPIFPEAKVSVGVEGALGRGAEPALPVDVFGCAFGVNVIVPLAEQRVARGSGLCAQKFANLARRDQLFRAMRSGSGKPLVANL